MYLHVIFQRTKMEFNL